MQNSSYETYALALKNITERWLLKEHITKNFYFKNKNMKDKNKFYYRKIFGDFIYKIVRS